MRKILNILAVMALVVSLGCGDESEDLPEFDSLDCDIQRTLCPESNVTVDLNGVSDVAESCRIRCTNVAYLGAAGDGVAYLSAWKGIESATNVTILGGARSPDVELAGLSDLERVGDLRVEDETLRSLDGLDSLVHAGNPAGRGGLYLLLGFEEFGELPQLQTVEGLYLEGTRLVSTSSFPSQAVVSHELVVNTNTELEAIEGIRLERLSRVSINRNRELRDISALLEVKSLTEPATSELGRFISISDNPNLSTCVVEEWVESLDPPVEAIIERNGPC